MAHIVCRKGRYYSLEESYREGKKVRKRTLFYFGARRPSDPQARYEQMIDTAERKGEAIDQAQREKYGETNAERSEGLKEEAKFSQEKFLLPRRRLIRRRPIVAKPKKKAPLLSPASEQNSRGKRVSNGERTCRQIPIRRGDRARMGQRSAL